MNDNKKIALESSTVVPSRKQVDDAVSLLKQWAEVASDEARAGLTQTIKTLLPAEASAPYPTFNQSYDAEFDVDAAYRASLPDLHNGPASLIRGENTHLQHVGISNFRLPLRYLSQEDGVLTLETSVTGTVSLEADRKGVNISRIMRSFYAHAQDMISFQVVEAALDAYKTDLETLDARILLCFSYPLQLRSLRSGLSGYQYYNIALELAEQNTVRKKIIHLDYVYSSTCPCSLELSEHARKTRGQLATPHSQRSVARISVELEKNAPTLWFEDLIAIARDAVPTETQVMVKREDEQAFAELNAANPVFVEDAVRSFAKGLKADARIRDFRVVASHQESLHSHDAVSIIVEGDTFASQTLEPHLFKSLIHHS